MLLGFALLYGNAPQEEPQMVDLNVVALDSHGQAVMDLNRDELSITDNGKPQTVAFFHHRDSALGAVPTLAPTEVSNRGRANVPRATLILFDMLNERFATRGFTANQLVHDLQPLESADYVYLYCVTLDGRLYAIHGLPGPEDDPAPAGAPPWTRQIKPLLDKAMRATSQVRPIDDADVTFRVELTYNALNAVAAQLSRVPGRKSLVWLTDGVPIALGPNRSDTGDFVDFTPMLRQLSEAFDRFGVAIYPVRQVMIGSPDSMGGAGTSGLGSLDTLDQFAAMTGGRPTSGKDVGAAVRQAITDMRTSYQVGYYPPLENWDGKFHKLRVNCTRKGVRIQTKAGYYAWQDAPGARSEQAIDSVMPTTFDAAEIGLRASLSHSPGSLGVHLDAHIDAHDIVLVHTGDQYDAELRLGIAAYAEGSQPKRGPVMPMDLHLSAQQRDKALQEGIAVVQDIALPRDVQTLRLIVFDRGSTAIGSVTLPVPSSGPGRPN
ncbi:MAG TPA: VWA domain-containing protein [Bryobacteraceae bacterium]|nr:VWA domain-containing protein [Bryobacteraceae bacterium]